MARVADDGEDRAWPQIDRVGREEHAPSIGEEAVEAPLGKRAFGLVVGPHLAFVVTDEDRPQRRSRTVSTERAPVERGSIASGGGSGGTSGMASFYWQPQRVASGGWFNPNAMTAAHKTLPFGTRVRVTHAGNGRSVDVTINDRGPYIAGRIIDLSKAAAGVINMTGQGVAKIKMTVLGR